MNLVGVIAVILLKICFLCTLELNILLGSDYNPNKAVGSSPGSNDKSAEEEDPLGLAIGHSGRSADLSVGQERVRTPANGTNIWRVHYTLLCVNSTRLLL
ncbi:hypothetical protein ACOSQ2_004275 [Xanthoceras sorbifolium]